MVVQDENSYLVDPARNVFLATCRLRSVCSRDQASKKGGRALREKFGHTPAAHKDGAARLV